MIVLIFTDNRDKKLEETWTACEYYSSYIEY